ncbi:hypothetical protein FRAHR75_1000016 [Frankia sp. Hr75.2]|nr:hypothetical protein FRAHR75_1000016 [Frankia sp. Hr75.2]
MGRSGWPGNLRDHSMVMPVLLQDPSPTDLHTSLPPRVLGQVHEQLPSKPAAALADPSAIAVLA